MSKRWFGAVSGLVAVAMFCSSPVAAQSADEAGVTVPQMRVPYSTYASPEARALAAKLMRDLPPDFGIDIAAARAYFDKYNDDRLAEVRRVFDVDVRQSSLGGVKVAVVTPRAGIAKANARRVLINVHGGAFMWGGGSGALIEAIPIAATAGIKVVTVDYRLAPENRFPAASEDVGAVYRALLAQYRPENIGIYGCSAGGIISVQAVAWIDSQHLAMPGAVGALCGATGMIGGDSFYLADPLGGLKPHPDGFAPDYRMSPYMAQAKANDPLAFPLESPEFVRRFPPTLFITGSRDFTSSSLTTAHRRLAAAGVPSDLFVFDGMWHSFFVYPELPESREAYGLIARFFEQHLGRPAPKR